MLLNPFRFGAPAPAVEDYPVLLSSQSGSLDTAAATHNIPLGTYNAGDLLFVFIAGRTNTSTSPTIPTGWLGFLNYQNTTPTPDGRKGYLYKVMTGTEGSTLSVTLAESQAITYAVLRFKAGSFEADLNYMIQLYVGMNTGIVSAALTPNRFMFFATCTDLREISIFGLQTVSAYPYPTGTNSEAAGTGVTTTAAKTAISVKENTAPFTASSTLPTWGFSAPASYYEVDIVLRGSRPLGYIDPRIILSWSLSTAGTSTNMVTPFRHAKEGDMIIAASRAETGVLTSLGGFTQFYNSGSVRLLYKVLTAADLTADLGAVYDSSGNHAGLLLRVRAGTFEAGAVPEVASTGSGTGTGVSVPSAVLGAGYSGKRNLGFVFESHVFTTSAVYMVSPVQYPLGPFQVAAASSNAVGCTGVCGVFDGVNAPGEVATLGSSLAWLTQLIVLKGLPIP